MRQKAEEKKRKPEKGKGKEKYIRSARNQDKSRFQDPKWRLLPFVF